MKKLSFLLSIIVIIFMSSCGTTYHGMSGGNGCGVWYPKKFERDARHTKRMNWVNNPRSGRYRSFNY
jgi:uncharacterized protein YceK